MPELAVMAAGSLLGLSLRCYRTSLERHHAGKLTEDVPLYAVGRIVEKTEAGRLI